MTRVVAQVVGIAQFALVALTTRARSVVKDATKAATGGNQRQNVAENFAAHANTDTRGLRWALRWACGIFVGQSGEVIENDDDSSHHHDEGRYYRMEASIAAVA